MNLPCDSKIRQRVSGFARLRTGFTEWPSWSGRLIIFVPLSNGSTTWMSGVTVRRPRRQERGLQPTVARTDAATSLLFWLRVASGQNGTNIGISLS